MSEMQLRCRSPSYTSEVEVRLKLLYGQVTYIHPSVGGTSSLLRDSTSATGLARERITPFRYVTLEA